MGTLSSALWFSRIVLTTVLCWTRTMCRVGIQCGLLREDGTRNCGAPSCPYTQKQGYHWCQAKILWALFGHACLGWGHSWNHEVAQSPLSMHLWAGWHRCCYLSSLLVSPVPFRGSGRSCVNVPCEFWHWRESTCGWTCLWSQKTCSLISWFSGSTLVFPPRCSTHPL